MKDAKPFWASKTLWTNVLALVAAVTGAFGLDLGLDAETQATIVVGILAVANIILRAVTDRPVRVKKPDGLQASPLAVAGAVILTLFLAACASQVAETPAQRVYAAQADYNALLAPAVAYESLPRCDEVDVEACSEPDVVREIRRADNAAWDALRAAQNTVRSSGASDSNVALAIAAAREAVAALRSILTREGVL